MRIHPNFHAIRRLIVTRLSVLFVLLMFAASPARAHDFWIEPSSYRPAAGELVKLRLKVGDRFDGDPLRRDPTHVGRFFAVQSGTTSDVPGREGSDPAGLVRIQAEGAVVIGYEGQPRTANLSPRRFARYVEEEGLENRVEAQARSVRDVYSRSAKTILGDWRTSLDAQRPIGLPLELVPVGDSGDRQAFTLLLNGDPLPDATVFAIPQGRPDAQQRALTGEDGIARFSVAPDAGPWLIKAVHISRTGAREYRSIWASLTLR